MSVVYFYANLMFTASSNELMEPIDYVRLDTPRMIRPKELDAQKGLRRIVAAAEFPDAPHLYALDATRTALAQQNK